MADNNDKLGFVVEITVDQKEVKAGFEGLRKELAGFKAGFEYLHQGIVTVLKSLKFIAEEMRHGTREAKKTTEAIDQQAEATKEAGEAVEDLSEETKQAKEAMDSQTSATKQAGSAMDDLSDEAKQAKKAIDTQAEATKEAGVAMDDLSAATGEATEETESLMDAFLGGVNEGLEQAVEESKRLDENTEDAGKSAGVLRGVWERIGHTIVDGAVSALRGLVSYLASALEQANEFDMVMQRMAARGVEGIDEMRVSIVKLASEVGATHVEFAQTVDLAESLGAGSEAVDVASAAWENYRVTGMDVATQVRISTRLARSFNLQMGEQAGLINQVATAAQQARVDQAALWNGLSAMGPKIQQVGGSMKDLLDVTKAAIAGGVKVEEEGVQGLSELLSNLARSSKEFGEALVESGVIVTESSPAWEKLNDQVVAQKDEFDQLNAEIKEYRDQISEIGLLASEAERTADQFEKLSAKRDAGIRLNRLERVAYREAKRELREYNDELSQFDKSGLIAGGKEWRKLSDVEQVRKRLEAAKEAQKDLNLASREAQLDAQETGEGYNKLNAALGELASKMATEIPGAIKTAISEGGLGQVLTQISEVPDALNAASVEVRALVTAVSDNLKNVSTDATTAGNSIVSVGDAFDKMAEQGTNGVTKLKKSLDALVAEVMAPLSAGLNKVSEMLREKLYEPLENNTTLASRVQTWATNLTAEMMADLEAIGQGDKTPETVIVDWITRGLNAAVNALVPIIKECLNRFWEALKLEFTTGQPDIEKWMADQIAGMAKRVIPAMGNAIGGFLDEHVGGAADWWMNKLGVNQGTAQAGVLNLGGTAGASTPSTTIYVNGAQDAGAVADEVSRKMARQERLGYGGSRVR